MVQTGGMIVSLQTERLRAMWEVRTFVEGSGPVEHQPRDRESAYGFVQRTLVGFGYHRVAALLNKLHVGEFTKSRARRRSNDNALVEGKVPPVVAAKLALYSAMRSQGVAKVALAARLGLSKGAVRKLLNPATAFTSGLPSHAPVS